MPKVELARGRRIATDPLPAVKKTAAETDLSTGVGVSEARAGKWGQVGRLGNIGVQVTQEISAVIEAEQKKTDALVDLEMDNKIQAWQQERLWHEQNGAMRQLGKNAQGLPETVGAEYSKFVSELGSTLVRPEQQAAFARRAENHRLEMDLTLKRHAGTQYQEFTAGEVQSGIANQLNAGRIHALDPAFVERALNNGQEIIAMYGPTLGQTPEEIKAKLGAFTSAMHGGVIEQLVVQEKTALAEAYFAKKKGEITDADVLLKVTNILDAGTTAQTGLNVAEEIWQRARKGLGDNDPVDIAALTQEAYARFGETDRKKYDATVHYLSQKKAAHDDARQTRITDTMGQLELKVSQGATLADFARDPIYLNATEKQRSDVMGLIDRRTQDKISQGRASITFAWGQEQRAKQKQEDAGNAMFSQLSTPAELRAMTPNAIQAQRSVLGDAHTNMLLKLQQQLQANEANLISATVDDDMIKAILAKAGKITHGPEANQAEIGAVKAAALNAIEAAQRGKGNKELTRPEKEALTQTIVDQKVMTPTWMGWGSREQVGAMVISANDRSKANVPLAKYKAEFSGQAPAEIEAMLNWIRTKDPTGTAGKSNAQLELLHQKRLERALALTFMGAPLIERTNVLEGKEP